MVDKEGQRNKGDTWLMRKDRETKEKMDDEEGQRNEEEHG